MQISKAVAYTGAWGKKAPSPHRPGDRLDRLGRRTARAESGVTVVCRAGLLSGPGGGALDRDGADGQGVGSVGGGVEADDDLVGGQRGGQADA